MYEEHHAGQCHCIKCTLAALSLKWLQPAFAMADVFAARIEGNSVIHSGNQRIDVRELIKVTLALHAYCRTLADVSGLVRYSVDRHAAEGDPIPPELVSSFMEMASQYAEIAKPMLATAGIVIPEREHGVH